MLFRSDGITLDRLLKVRNMLAIDDTAVAHNVNRQDGILVLGRDEAEDGELVDGALHRDVVEAGLERHVLEERVADGFTVDGKVHGHVAEVDGHDAGVGDEDVADHVGAVGEFFVDAGEDF